MWQDALAEFQNTFSVVPVGAAMARLLTAVVLGGLIGIEREWRHKPAGLRTHILVCVAACLFVILGLEISQLDFGQDDQQRQRQRHQKRLFGDPVADAHDLREQQPNQPHH